MRSACKWPHETHAESHVNAQSEPIVSDLIWIDLNAERADSPEAEIAVKLKKKKKKVTDIWCTCCPTSDGNATNCKYQIISLSHTVQPSWKNHDYTLLRNILNLKWQVCIWHQGFLDLSSRPDRLHIGVYLNKCSEMGSIHSGKNRPGLMFPFLSLKAVMKAVASHRKS